MRKSSDGTVLVLGANGKTGGRVAARLTERGIDVRRGSRSGTPRFDWEAPSSWAPALAGVRAIYLTYQPDVAMPGAEEVVRDFTTLAATSGVEQIVFLSGRGEIEAERAERVVQDSGTGWTIIRSSFFQQNFSESFLLDPVRAGEVALPVGAIGEPFADADDIADIAVAALTDPRHDGELYEVTGPRLLSFAEAVGEIATATGRPIGFVAVPLSEYESYLRAAEVPAEYIWLITYLFGTVMDGRNASLQDGVQRALGRPPRDFREYAARTAATGIWEPSTELARAL